MVFLGMLYPNDIKVVFTPKTTLRACLHAGEGRAVGEVTRLGGVTCLSMAPILICSRLHDRWDDPPHVLTYLGSPTSM